MKLREWLIGQYGVNLDTSGDMSGVDIVDALCKSLCDAGFSFNDQISVLLQAPDYYCNDEFLGACVDRVKLIRHRLDELRDAREHHLAECAGGVSERQVRPPAAEVARLRFVAAWPIKNGGRNEVFDIVDDMLLRMASAGYIDSSSDALLDLRQGLGYYRPGEDYVRLRAPVRWLRGQNALHWWLCALLGDHGAAPLIRVPVGGPGRWVTAASIFADRNGGAYVYSQLEHGRPSNDTQRSWLDATVPLRPLSLN